MLKIFPTTNYDNPKSHQEGKRDRESLRIMVEELQKPGALEYAAGPVRNLSKLIKRRLGMTDSRLNEIREEAVDVFDEAARVFQTSRNSRRHGAPQIISTALEEDLVRWDADEDQAARDLKLKGVDRGQIDDEQILLRRLTRYAALVHYRVIAYCDEVDKIFWTRQGLEGAKAGRRNRIKEHTSSYTASLLEVTHAISQFKLAEHGRGAQFFRTPETMSDPLLAKATREDVSTDKAPSDSGTASIRPGLSQRITPVHIVDSESDDDDFDYVRGYPVGQKRQRVQSEVTSGTAEEGIGATRPSSPTSLAESASTNRPIGCLRGETTISQRIPFPPTQSKSPADGTDIQAKAFQTAIDSEAEVINPRSENMPCPTTREADLQGILPSSPVSPNPAIFSSPSPSTLVSSPLTSRSSVVSPPASFSIQHSLSPLSYTEPASTQGLTDIARDEQNQVTMNCIGTVQSDTSLGAIISSFPTTRPKDQRSGSRSRD